MNQPTLSVVIPNYNHGHYLRQLLEAICKQSFKPVEIILIDDASTDNSVEIIESMMREYPIIQLLQNEKNLGHIYSAKRGLDLIKGDYFLDFSADDQVMPGFFEKSMNLLAKHPEAGLCTAFHVVIDENGEEHFPGDCRSPSMLNEPPHITNVSRYFSPDEALQAYMERGWWLPAPPVIWRKEAVKDVGAYTMEAGSYIDAFSIYLVALNYGACLIPEPLVRVNLGPNRFSSEFTTVPEKYLELIGPMSKLMTGKFVDKFPKEFVEDLKKKDLYSYSIIALNKIKSAQDKSLEYFKYALEEPTALDYVFFVIH